MRHGSLLHAVILTTVAVFLTGCSRNPVAPSTGTTTQPGAGTSVIGSLPDDPPSSDGGTPITRTVALTATDEGAITVGRFTLWVRKNSLKMPATITLRVNDPEAMDVILTISPAAANDFASPVILTANTSDVANFDYATGTMQYWDGAWEQLANVASHPNQENVVAHLDHLSNCKVTNGAGGGKGKIGA